MNRRVVSFVLLCGFILSNQGVLARDSSLVGWLSPKVGQRIWGLNPSSLESYCVYQTLCRDRDSAAWIQQLTGCPAHLVLLLANLVARAGLESGDDVFLGSHENHEAVCWLHDQFSSGIKDEIDLGRELIFSEFNENSDVEQKIAWYSLFLDVLALRARAIYFLRTQRGDQCRDKEEQHISLISAINTLLFEEMGIRYPSKKEMFEEKFSLLSSVVSGKFGVCLGVSSLYLCIAQRLGVPLEIITPPGHIYLRYLKSSGEYLNIETTAGGCHYETERYESIDIEGLTQRSMKEVVGLTFMNQGSFFLYAKNYRQAAHFYEKAASILQDSLLKELLAISLILSGKETEGEKLLKSVLDKSSNKNSIASQYLSGKIGKGALEIVFSEPRDSYEDLLSYGKQLQWVSDQYPDFLDARRKLASIFLQLGKTREALNTLEYCYSRDSDNLSLVLSLCQLYLERMDYLKAKIMLTKGEELSLKKHSGWYAVRKMRTRVARVAP
ncbi:transglutaminase family protein [Chlamydiifrater volucris]|uniref:transglutaminase family protein n=1 Tax=Chlamydiifrater volucris TaxID=2681470 RepID=UPI0032B2EA9A